MAQNLNDFPDIPVQKEASTLQEALLNWIETIDYETESCCKLGHFINKKPMPDKSVCVRELMWRRYVRQRDKNPKWMPRNYGVLGTV